MIRKATTDDLDFLYELCLDMCSVAGYDKGGLIIDKESSFAYGRKMINDDDKIVFIAEKNGKPIASIGLVIFPWEHNVNQNVAGEEWWYVHPDHRGDLKLVNALIDLAEWWAKRNGAISIWMSTMNNRKTDLFFRRNKFHKAHSIHIKEIT